MMTVPCSVILVAFVTEIVVGWALQDEKKDTRAIKKQYDIIFFKLITLMYFIKKLR